MKRKSRMIGLLLAMCLAIGMLPTVALAATEEVLVNGVNLAEDEDYSIACGEGTAKYDSATGTITLTNATITESAGTRIAGIYIAGVTQDITIVLEGKNVMSLVDTSKKNNGIWCDSAVDLKIEGTGSLDITLYRIDHPYCIFNDKGSIFVKDATINAKLAEGLSGIGSVVETGYRNTQNITIENATISGKTFLFGLFANDAMTIKNSNIDIESVDATLYNGWGDMIIEDSNIKAKATDEGCSSICAWGKLNITKSNVVATANGSGIYSFGKMTVLDSNVSATSTGADGLIAYAGLDIKESTVAVNGKSIGIYTGDVVNVESGELSAKGESYAVLARKISGDDLTVKPSDSPIAITIGEGHEEKSGAKISTKDWELKQVWDDLEWDYYEKWESISYFTDTEDNVLKEIRIAPVATENPEKPNEPSEGTAPDNTLIDKPSDTSASDSVPNTGDNFNMTIWIALAMISLITVASIVFCDRRKVKK